ncbi:MAG: IS91 family transposase [Proteobacteria bacterium]|nr:IS91 family transposase [Pseudomonadota bacterium]MBU4298212.1 IS91 family transposase [Pseudomonadota bacterium]MCG2747480.1 IS91 family transposase [Desulfobulbaceae bacterium]
MAELADVFRQYGRQYLETFGEAVLPSHRRAIADIAACRTEALGGYLVQCDSCAAQDKAYRSCKNRACPKCHRNDTLHWLDKRAAELLPVMYFHVVFTLPEQLRRLVRGHQKTLYAVLMKAAAEALMKIAADPKYVGGKIGIMALLHTWTSAGIYHPHVHCLVPGGGISPDKSSWISSRKNFLVPVKALSPIFRAKFLEMAQDALPCLQIPREVWEHDWVVYAKPTVQGTDNVMEYIARYVHRIFITNHRLLKVENGEATFRYRKTTKRKKKWRHCQGTMTLPVMEFMRRFLQHVLPAGFHKVRYYGLLHPVNRPLLRRVQLILGPAAKSKEVNRTEAGHEKEPCTANCRFCKKGRMVVIARLLPVMKRPELPGLIPARSPP